MLSRYQIGPVAVVAFFLVMAAMCVVGLYGAVWQHHWNGWLIAATALLSGYNFHMRFSRNAD